MSAYLASKAEGSSPGHWMDESRTSSGRSEPASEENGGLPMPLCFLTLGASPRHAFPGTAFCSGMGICTLLEEKLDHLRLAMQARTLPYFSSTFPVSPSLVLFGCHCEWCQACWTPRLRIGLRRLCAHNRPSDCFFAALDLALDFSWSVMF